MLNGQLTDGDVTVVHAVARLRLPGTDPTIDAAIDSVLIAVGIETTDVTDVLAVGWEAAHRAAMDVLFGEALMVNDDIWRHHRHQLGADLVERFTFAQTISPTELAEARARRVPWRAELAEVFGAFGVLVLPTMTAYPARLGEHGVGPNPAAAAVNLAGHPAMTVPVPSGGLLPAGLQLVAPDHHEPRLLATAAVIEAAVTPQR